jgi:hypothetical protein
MSGEHAFECIRTLYCLRLIILTYQDAKGLQYNADA